MNDNIYTYYIYTDGSCKGKNYTSRKGGWAGLIVYDGDIILTLHGSEQDTTNQRMELLAAINLLDKAFQISEKHAKNSYHLFSDSAYLVNCWKQKWYMSWIYNGWTTSKGEEVKNIDLWERLIPYFKNKNIVFELIKGHSTNEYNNLCDSMAQQEASLH